MVNLVQGHPLAPYSGTDASNQVYELEILVLCLTEGSKQKRLKRQQGWQRGRWWFSSSLYPFFSGKRDNTSVRSCLVWFRYEWPECSVTIRNACWKLPWGCCLEMLESSSKNFLLLIQHSDRSNMKQNVFRMTLRDLNSPHSVKLGYLESNSPWSVQEEQPSGASCQLERKVSRKSIKLWIFSNE